MMYIDVRPLPEEGKYQLITSVIIEGIHIPELFKWDGASIPKVLWSVLISPFDPKVMAPSMVHDYLYGTPNVGYTRKECDEIFKKLLIANGLDEESAESLYTGCRMGGKSHWIE